MDNAQAIEAAFGGDLPPGITGTNERCTILVTNLNPDVSTSECDIFHSARKKISILYFNIFFKFGYFRESMNINCSTCSLFMGTLSESKFSEVNQIMHLFRWEMVSKLNWRYTF
jgi:hypothetical protein